MFRSLSMYPSSADSAQVDDVTERVVAHFRQSPGFRSATTSVDALMGPGAKSGDVARVVMVDFDTLDDALAALQAEEFAEAREADMRVGATHFLFECREL